MQISNVDIKKMNKITRKYRMDDDVDECITQINESFRSNKWNILVGKDERIYIINTAYRNMECNGIEWKQQMEEVRLNIS